MEIINIRLTSLRLVAIKQLHMEIAEDGSSITINHLHQNYHSLRNNNTFKNPYNIMVKYIIKSSILHICIFPTHAFTLRK